MDGNENIKFDDELIGEDILDDLSLDSESDEAILGELEDELDTDDLNTEELSESTDIEDDDIDDDLSDDEMDNDFIDNGGNIVVQDTKDGENSFDMKYIDLDKIAITKRIRVPHSVESLVKSIKSTGLLHPIVVAPTATEGMYVLLDGFRRIQAYAKLGKKQIPSIVNNKINTPEIPIIEAMYNHSMKYSIQEKINYIDYLEKQHGIQSASMFEYLLQMDNGDYSKLKDILNDNDEDIVTKLLDGVYDISTAFRKLEQRRKKESAEEKENRKAEQVYGNEEKSGADKIEGAGETDSKGNLTEEQLKSISTNIENLDNEIEEQSLGQMLQEGDEIEGFKPHKQKVGEREYIDPVVKKSVMIRDKGICQCCKKGGPQFADILDYHHVIPVFLGGTDTADNGTMLCVACHRLVHLYSTGDLTIDKALLEDDYESLSDEKKAEYENEQIFEDQKKRFKRIIFLGSKIRQGMAQKGINREQYKKDHPNTGIGRRKPGVGGEQEID